MTTGSKSFRDHNQLIKKDGVYRHHSNNMVMPDTDDVRAAVSDNINQFIKTKSFLITIGDFTWIVSDILSRRNKDDITRALELPCIYNYGVAQFSDGGRNLLAFQLTRLKN